MKARILIPFMVLTLVLSLVFVMPMSAEAGSKNCCKAEKAKCSKADMAKCSKAKAAKCCKADSVKCCKAKASTDCCKIDGKKCCEKAAGCDKKGTKKCTGTPVDKKAKKKAA